MSGSLFFLLVFFPPAALLREEVQVFVFKNGFIPFTQRKEWAVVRAVAVVESCGHSLGLLGKRLI